jgi:hypothetical protein
MKKIILSIVAIATISLTSFGQAPEGFQYQAVVRDAGNLILDNQAVGVQLTIQQGSIGGTAVYTETFAPISNAFGLVNLQIGTGTTSDDFTTLDWANGPYFIETAIDATGGTSYSVMGTSQLMSVPYALYAKTSGNGAGPVGPAGADGIDGVDGAAGSQGVAGNDGVDGATGPQGVAGNDGVDGMDGVDGNDGATGGYPVHTIGENYGGGIVFYVYDGGQHGLIAAPNDQGTSVSWANGTLKFTGSTGDGLDAGAMNTAMIVASQIADNPTGNFAAKACAEYSVTAGGITYGDWYMPSKYELNLLYLQEAVVGNMAIAGYWNSSESTTNLNGAGIQFFDTGGQSTYNKNGSYYVRAIRAF